MFTKIATKFWVAVVTASKKFFIAKYETKVN